MQATAYFEAIARGDVERLQSMLEARPELLAARSSPSYAPERQLQCSGLHAAVYSGQPAAARVLVDAGIDLEARTVQGRSALHDSIEFGCSDITTLLLERGAEVDVCSAAILGRIERLRELLGRDPALANDRSTQLSPLGWAAFGNQVTAATVLLDSGARMDDGELQCAAAVGHAEVGRLLIDHGADPNEMRNRATALHAAASMKYTRDASSFVRMLLECGADVRIRTAEGKTARQVAEDKLEQQNSALASDPATERRNYEAIIELLRAADGGS